MDGAPKLVEPPKTFLPEPRVIDTLEDMLAHAKRGEITAIAVAAITYKGEATTVFGGYNLIALLGSLSILKARVLAELR